MCGIAGMIKKRDKINSITEIESMLSAIHHRGPDDRGICCISIDGRALEEESFLQKEIETRVILGFDRLSIRDLSKFGHQPMLSSERNVCLTFNGEIYNADELREKLLLEANYTFKGHSDTEVILAAYMTWGFDKMIKNLNGMFAIVIYDARSQEFYIARDRVGIIPLHVYEDDNNFIWSSEIKAFLQIKGIRLSLSNHGLYSSFAYPFLGTDMYDNVSHIEPGHYWRIQYGSWLKEDVEYYSIKNYKSKSQYGSIDEIIESAESILSKAVKQQLVSDVSVGVQFSGGVDSTLIANYASKYLTDIKGFSMINSNSPEHSEEKWIDLASSKIDITLKKIDMNAQMFISNLERTTYAFERFVNDPSPIGIYEFSKCARNDVTVLLSGEGADELCGGYQDYLNYKAYETSKGVDYIGSDEYLLTFNRQCKRDVCIGMLNEFSDDSLLEERRNIWDSYKGTNFEKNRNMFFRTLLQGLLERQNKICMANSIENRVPMLDNEFIDFIFSLPEDALIGKREDQYVGKYILKILSEKVYGTEFAFRKKQSIRVPIVDYFAAKEFKDYVMTQIIPSMKQRGIVNMKTFMDAYNNINLANVISVWKAINIEIWAQLFLDGRKPM